MIEGQTDSLGTIYFNVLIWKISKEIFFTRLSVWTFQEGWGSIRMPKHFMLSGFLLKTCIDIFYGCGHFSIYSNIVGALAV